MPQEFFESFVRELKQCASGEGVESIEGDQKKKAVYTLLPPEGAGEMSLAAVFPAFHGRTR